MNKSKFPLVSVIITTKNEEKNIKTCLVSIKNQTYQNIEIIVVDNNSIDSTKKLASEYTKYVYNKGPERSAQRNFGASKSKGKYLLFLDADMKASRKVVEECVKAIELRDVGGIIIPEESYGVGFWAKCKKLERSYYIDAGGIEAARFYKTSVFKESKGFDIGMVSGEDWDLSSRIRNVNKLDRIDSFIFHNEGELSLMNTVKKKYYYATKISVYLSKNQGKVKSDDQLSIISRYRLFLSNYKKIIEDPVLFTGMLFMKSCEFTAGFFGLYFPIKLL